MSWVAAMLYHQKRLAAVNAGSRCRPASQTLSPATRRLDCRQSHTSLRSRKSQPLAMMPWSRGRAPVMNAAWTVQVTAGVTVSSGREAPARASAPMCGVSGPMWRGDNPTTRITRGGRMGRILPWYGGGGRGYAIDIAPPQNDYAGNNSVTTTPGMFVQMTIAAHASVSLTTLLRLGRVSNLPTVWTNVLAGTVLAGGDWRSGRVGLVLLAMSLFYVGGMYLNDYFDRAVDARERPARPIPAGDISAAAVAGAGAPLLACAVALMALAGAAAAITGVLLALFIVGYDAHHKEVTWAPLVMGGCRALVYCGAAAVATGTVSTGVLFPALACAAYVAGITYAASRASTDMIGSLWPLALLSAPLLAACAAFTQGVLASIFYLALAVWLAGAVYLLVKRPHAGAVSRAVGWLIAGISLVDAAYLAGAGAIEAACWAVVGFAATLALHKQIAGT